MTNSQKIYKLDNGQIVDKSRYFRLKRKAEILGCKLSEVPDKRGRHGNHLAGKGHPRYNANKITSHGYRIVIVGVGHPLDIGNGYAYEHRKVMSEKIGRWVTNDEIVHHIDRDKLNNNIDNLEITTRAEHNREHIMTDNKRDGSTGRFTGKHAAGSLLDGVEHKEFPKTDAKP